MLIAGERLYIIDGNYRYIYSMDVDGNNQKIHHQESNVPFQCIAIDEFYIYVGVRYDGWVYQNTSDALYIEITITITKF